MAICVMSFCIKHHPFIVTSLINRFARQQLCCKNIKNTFRRNAYQYSKYELEGAAIFNVFRQNLFFFILWLIGFEYYGRFSPQQYLLITG